MHPTVNEDSHAAGQRAAEDVRAPVAVPTRVKAAASDTAMIVVRIARIVRP